MKETDSSRYLQESASGRAESRASPLRLQPDNWIQEASYRKRKDRGADMET